MLRLIILTVALALAASTTAAAAKGGDHYRVAPTLEGQIAATAATLTTADFSFSSDWKGGPRKIDLHAAGPSCGSFRPKRSDITLNADAMSTFTSRGIVVVSDAQVFATPAMVQLDLRRMRAPGMLGCLKATAASSLRDGHVVSAREIHSPSASPGSHAYRVLELVGTRNVEVAEDVIVIAKGRTEITLMTLAPLTWMKEIGPAQTVLATVLYSRISA